LLSRVFPVSKSPIEALFDYSKLRVFNLAMTTPDLYLPRLDAMIDLQHPLAVLGESGHES